MEGSHHLETVSLTCQHYIIVYNLISLLTHSLGMRKVKFSRKHYFDKSLKGEGNVEYFVA